MARVTVLVLALSACAPEYSIREEDPPPPADPPGLPVDEFGDPPNWQACTRGLLGLYGNLSADHPDVEPREEPTPVADPLAVDWFDPSFRVFERFDASLDFGRGWWPVDEGLVGDPEYFSVRWLGWLRVTERGGVDVVLGGDTDAWVIVSGAVVAADDADGFVPASRHLDLSPGQYRLDVRYAHRAGPDDAFRFRVVGGDALICAPDRSGG
jgi:hypothetical protein